MDKRDISGLMVLSDEAASGKCPFYGDRACNQETCTSRNYIQCPKYNEILEIPA